jgi:multimeric flavodoxin WrbA
MNNNRNAYQKNYGTTMHLYHRVAGCDIYEHIHNYDTIIFYIPLYTLDLHHVGQKLFVRIK